MHGFPPDDDLDSDEESGEGDSDDDEEEDEEADGEKKPVDEKLYAAADATGKRKADGNENSTEGEKRSKVVDSEK